MQINSDMNITSYYLFDNNTTCKAVRFFHQAAVKSLAPILLLLVSSLLSSCGLLQKFGILSEPEAPQAPVVQAPPPPPPPPLSEQPYQLNVKLSASADLNPDTQSRPSPVQVRIFVSDAQSELKNKEFEEVFEFEGNSIEPRPLTTITVRPGQTRNLFLPANKSQSLVMIAAAYRDPYQSLWKAIASVRPQDAVNISATVGADAVTITPGR